MTVAVDDRDGQMAFLYRVTPGAADRSYGVQVARLAGLPGLGLTERAALLLALREGDSGSTLVDLGRRCSSGEDESTGETSEQAPTPTPVSGAERGEDSQARVSQILDGQHVPFQKCIAAPCG